MKKIEPFPLGAIVGLEQAKRSLIYHAIDPRLGGVLLVGHRGCAKTTMARGFAELLPGPLSHPGDAPFVEIPLGTTEDRLLGSVHAQALVESATWGVQTGLIEQANGGVLYVDEINLLQDHLADFILDSAATGQYRMERDGMTRQVESRYVLIGTMNPEEGELRPQLSDRFAHCVRIEDNFSEEERIEAVRRRIEFDDAPDLFRARFGEETKKLQAKILQARLGIAKVEITDEVRKSVAEHARRMAVEGLRAELAVIRTARAAAAWQGRTAVNEENLKEAWELCLGHRQTEQQPNQMPTTRPPDSPRSKTNEANGGNALSPSTPGSSMAMTPREADPRPHPLKPVVVRNALEMLREELMHKPNAAAQTESKRDRLSTQRTGTADSIAWLASICRSWTHGWRPGNERFEVMYHHPQRRPSLWVFLDASRSTGARQFLSRAREEIKGLARQLKSWRFEIVLLHGDGIRWIARRAGRMGAIQALDALPDARGKSLLEEGVGAVTRARLRRGANANDGIIVCSDGYVSPAVNETGGRARRRLRRALERLRQTKASVFAWLYPEPVRGMSEWIPKLCSGFKAHLISIKLS